MSENQLYDLQCVLVALLAGAFFVALVVRSIRSVQPGFALGRIIAVAFGVRITAALAVSNLSAAQSLRGGDELTFLTKAQSLANWDLVSTASWKALTHQLHVFVFSLDFRVFDRVPDLMLRAQVIAVAVAGLAFLAAAVYEVAGARAAVVAAWILALEPSNVFFSGILHKEPFMLLAEGLVAFGGALLWKRGRFGALLPLVLGCLIATATRPYVGWFLATAAAAVTLHASLRWKARRASIALATLVVALGVAFFPTVWNASSKKNLQTLQASQDANAADTSANLSLERVDYSTRGKVIANLPQRMLDIVTKPYPWQLGNLSQQLGLIGTTTLWLLLLLVARSLVANPRGLSRAGPLLYPTFFLLVAYSLSAGNAGTAFRYRTHLVAFVIALLAVLRSQRAEAPAEASVPARTRFEGVVARSQTT